MLKTYTVAEFFCGCGGLSHGFSRTGRYHIVLGNDIKKAALETFRYNHTVNGCNPEIINQDIRETSTEHIIETLASRGVMPDELDCLIGGPPCQGFSQMRRSEERHENRILRFKGYNKLNQDPRNELVLRFLEIAAILRPKFILIENVPQMLSHSFHGIAGGLVNNIRSILEDKSLGYKTVVGVLNAADYGVPQLRERFFLLASRVGNVELPFPTHRQVEHGLFNTERIPWVNVAAALQDLPEPSMNRDYLGGREVNLYHMIQDPSYSATMQSKKHFPYNHITRSYSRDIMRIIREMQPGETWDHASNRMQFQIEAIIASNLLKGESRDDTINRLHKEGKIHKSFLKHYYWSAYTRLAFDRPALTITANANFLGSGRFTHPLQDRGITMREAARLQSFDDDFKFITSAGNIEDTTNIGVGLDMIGEAVPPLLAEAFALQICRDLDAYYQRFLNIVPRENIDRENALAESI